MRITITCRDEPDYIGPLEAIVLAGRALAANGVIEVENGTKAIATLTEAGWSIKIWREPKP